MNTTWEHLRGAESRRPRRDLAVGGISRYALEQHYVRTSHGHYRSPVELTSIQRIMDAAVLMSPGAVIGGWAAGLLHGVEDMDGRHDLSLEPLPVTVLLPPGQHRRSIPGVTYRQSKDKVESVEVGGLPVTPVLLTAEQLARWAADLTRAVMALDSMLGADVINPAATNTLAALVGGRGAVQARNAAELARPGVLSPWESRTRLYCELEAGYPPLLINEPVYSLSGQLLGIPDLLDEQAGVAIEYDGARWLDGRGHRELAQHRNDNVREERFERTGLIVVRVDSSDLTKHRPELRRRLRSARAQGLARDRTRDRWTLDPTPTRREGGPR